MTREPAVATLTFLFADLESSTRLWEQFPDAMKAAMARHDTILRAAVEDAAGRVVKTTGDGLMAVFPSACDAVEAAISAQQGLGAENWPDTGPLRTRIGLHSGEAQPREGDFFGSPVNRAARIMAAAHGGQVLLSSLTAGLAREGGLPAGAALRDLGEHRLKDLLQPERIFQLTHPALAGDFAPLATLGRRPNNLPIQTSELIGRETELAVLHRHLDSPNARLATLTGPGGIGKTRLAIQAAADRIDRYADGVFFVDLSAARDTDAVLAAIAITTGVGAATDVPVAVALRDGLRDRQLLLVLDNFEQAIEAADSVAELLAHTPRMAALVTSREALRVRGERLLPVAPLGLPETTAGATAGAVAGHEAVRLFVDRARAARPDFELTDANAAIVAEICRQLDGLPLAIELAAARLRLFSTSDLLDRLRRRLELLRGGARDLPARQQTLRSTIEWSHDLLDADERLVFAVLAVFAGARVEAVEEVAAEIPALSDVDVVERLTTLVDKSLLRSVEQPSGHRLTMLGTIHDFAAERLDDEPTLREAAVQAHARHFAASIARTQDALHGSGRREALDELAAELENLGAAWRHWLAAGDLARLNGMFGALWTLHEARGWYHAAAALATDLLAALERAPAHGRQVEDELTLRMTLARALLAIRGYTDEVEAVYRAALDLAGSADQLPRRFPILRSLANFHLYRAELDRTAAIAVEILELGEQQGDDRVKLEGHFLRGSTRAFLGDVPAGLDELAQAIALFDPERHAPSLRLGPSLGVAAHTTSALLLWFTGYPERADRHAADALRLADRLDHPYTLAYGTFHVGLLDLLARRPHVARERAAAVRRLADERDYDIWRALGLVLEGVSMTGLGAADDGLAMSERGIALYQNLRTPPIFWPTLTALRAAAFGWAGRFREGLELADAALSLDTGAGLQAPDLMLLRGEMLLGLGQSAEAETALRKGFALATELGSRTAQLRAATLLAELSARSGDRTRDAADDAESLRRTLAEFEEGADTPDQVEARQLLEALAASAD